MMELKEYQSAALESFRRWLEALSAARAESDTAIAALQKAGAPISSGNLNYPKAAWQQLAQSGNVAENAGEYVSRTDDAGRPIPHICFKVPTGGGKTLLAASALERLGRQTGLVIWIVPSDAIYQQTKEALWNREHPYRQMLERASGGRVKMLEKEDQFTGSDVAHYLCVLLLMYPSANRKKGREFLRMFRDSGRYSTFFPDSDDALSDGTLLNDCCDLERTSEDGPVKQSLFNVFKMLRPVVVLDEAHKAYRARSAEDNEEFARSVSRIDPSMVIELSATPNRGISNLLVDISGVELKAEEMIKLPVQVTSFPNGNVEWKHVLEQAAEQLESVANEAQSLQNSEGRYIRPIAVVRVERTGNDQRDGERIHAEDVREYLVSNLAVPEDAVRVKSSVNDELGRENLLSESSPVRWIITKAALAEGWDCPFAYLLVMLDNTRSQTAITQLVGRVMRQPHARRTGRELLDQCYVYCWNTDVGDAVNQVKNGLEQAGLTGLGGEVISQIDQSGKAQRITVQRRKQFRSQDIFLPLVLHRDGGGWIELDYQRHILPEIDWDAIPSPAPQSSVPAPAQQQTASVDVGDAQPVFHQAQEVHIDKTVKLSWFARHLSEIVPNAWQGARIAQQFLERLREGGQTDDQIHDRRSYLAHALREYVKGEVESRSEGGFRDKLTRGEIRFDLETSQHNYRMAASYTVPAPKQHSGLMTRRDQHSALQLNLFKPIYSESFDSDLERCFARYLDEQSALRWWHRVAARQRGDYYLRGWRQGRIWPDFVAMAGDDDNPQVLVFETKGGHLIGNEDTEYKRRVLEALQGAFNTYGQMTVGDGPAKGTFRLVFDKNKFPEALSGL